TLRHEVRPVGGPGVPGTLLVEGERFNRKRVYAPPPLPNVPVTFGSSLEPDALGRPVLWLATSLFGTAGLWADPITRHVLPHAVAAPAAAPAIIAEALGPNSGLQALTTLEPQATATRFQVAARRDASDPDTAQVRVPIGEMVEEVWKAAAAAQRQLQND